MLDVPGWPGHRAGQHVDVRLTAEDGYQAQRSYSIASPPEDARLELTVERLADGEVSPYLGEELRAGRRDRAARADRRLVRVGAAATAGRCCSSPAARAWCRSMAMLRHRAASGSDVAARAAPVGARRSPTSSTATSWASSPRPTGVDVGSR